MEKISFDSGIREFQLGDCGVLRFNPGDPNLYARFLEAEAKIQAAQEALSRKASQLGEDTDGSGLLLLLKEADSTIKEVLGWVFGPGNNFEELLGGVNLMAVGSNGQRIITNLFTALTPVLTKGVACCVEEKKAQAVHKAKSRRAGQ